jgi:hypothetical protein
MSETAFEIKKTWEKFESTTLYYSQEFKLYATSLS